MVQRKINACIVDKKSNNSYFIKKNINLKISSYYGYRNIRCQGNNYMNMSWFRDINGISRLDTDSLMMDDYSYNNSVKMSYMCINKKLSDYI